MIKTDKNTDGKFGLLSCGDPIDSDSSISLFRLRGENGKYGFINRKGAFVVVPQFDAARRSFGSSSRVIVQGGHIR